MTAPTNHSVLARLAIANALIAVIYVAAAKLGLSLAVVAPQVTAVWPPAGIALAAVVLFGFGVVPGIAVGAFIANFTANETIPVAAGIALGNTLEAVAGAWLLRLASFRPTLDRPRHVVALAVLAGCVSTAIAATIGAASLCAGGVPWAHFGPLWTTWWLGDGMGVLVLAPAILILASGSRPPRSALPETLAFTAALIAATALIFLTPVGVRSQLNYLLAPLFVWSALRLGPAVTATAVVLVSALAVWSIANRAPEGTLNERLLMLQTFMGTLAVASLILSAATLERRSAEDSLRTSEARLRIALDAGRMGAWDWDLATQRVTWSPNLEIIHGLAPGSFPGTFDAVLEGAHPEDRQRLHESVSRSLHDRSEHRVEYRVVMQDGSIRWLEGRGRPTLDPDGRITGMSGLCMDITDRKRAEEQLRRSNTDLEDFAHIVSHDLREPLRSIGQSVEFLIEDAGPALDQACRARLDSLRDLTGRLGRQVSALLEFSKVGRTELAVAETDLSQIVADALAPLRDRLNEESIELRVSPLPRLRCDPIRVGQVFANLITNACKYNDRADKRIEVGVMHGPTPRTAPILYVRDNGIGISPEHRDRVFQIFRRLHSADHYGGGVGAGLAIVKSIVERHHGRIWFESVPGQGTTFYFTLGPDSAPTTPRDSAPHTAPPHRSPQVAIAPLAGHPRRPATADRWR